ncbi:MAG: NADH-quinone oxidoreductase subunit M [Verrucomicrobia bacterium]|nr:NADH-quinone oxidoreductase subunit M [Verrucomicrobiota bacterium]
MLSLIIWLPILTALFLFLTPIRGSRLARWIALLPMFVVLAAAFFVFHHSPPAGEGRAFVVECPWAPDLGISYHLGSDRLNALLILLTALVGTAAIWGSQATDKARYFYALALIMAGGMAGAFASLDLFFFFMFHEFALIPTFILIGIWGAEHRRRAAMKITLYLGLGSLVLLLGLIGLYVSTGARTFDLAVLKQHLANAPLPYNLQVELFGALFLGFGILISLFPFHTWAPTGYGEAPPLAAMLHAGVIKKFGLYGLIVVAVPLLPDGFEFWKPAMVWLAMGNLLWCGYVAMQQRDLRYMLAYSSVSHMGYAFLAIAAATPVAAQGLMIFLFAHGLSAAVGFGIVGHCREQTGTCRIPELGGLARQMPFAAAVFTMAALAGCGLPGFANFPAEMMIFLGIFERFPCATVFAVWTVVISAVYLLRAIRDVFLGGAHERWASACDPGWGRRAALVLLLATLFFSGFFPSAVVGDRSASDPTLVRAFQKPSRPSHPIPSERKSRYDRTEPFFRGTMP